MDRERRYPLPMPASPGQLLSELVSGAFHGELSLRSVTTGKLNATDLSCPRPSSLWASGIWDAEDGTLVKKPACFI